MIAVLLILIALMLMLMNNTREMFGYEMNESAKDLTEYVEVEDPKVTHDILEKLILATNEYVSQKTGLCTYVIETTSLKKYEHRESKKEFYRCNFMLMKQHGFAFGFAVTVDIDMAPNGVVNVLSARTQPIDVNPPAITKQFMNNIEGHEYIPHERFGDSELKMLKNMSL